MKATIRNAASTKFWALEFGRGEGCDYTIACNQRITPLKANTITEAFEECKTIVLDCNFVSDTENRRDEIRHAEIVIVETKSAHILGVNEIITKMREGKQKAVEEEAEADERAEFERLSKKYN